MVPGDDADLQPLAARDGEPAFAEAWQAEALALADSLVQNGLFAAAEWSDALGLALREAEARGEPDDQETYYRAVLVALERLIDAHSDIDFAAMRQMRENWEDAYRATPHGQPVELESRD